MGGKKKQTAGWRYYFDILWGLCKAADELVGIVVADREAWSGSVTSNGRVSINKPQLLGGDKSEGGIIGDLDVMFGDPSQTYNTYLADAVIGHSKRKVPAVLGIGSLGPSDPAPEIPAMRGRVMALWRGGQVGSNNPNPRPWWFRMRRALNGWENDTPWYPEKAVIVMRGQSTVVALNKATLADLPAYSTVTIGGLTTTTLADVPSGSIDLPLASGTGIANGDAVTGPAGVFASATTVASVSGDEIHAMNAAHILYESITNSDWGKGDPSALINDSQWRAAADTLYAEGMGLCMQYNDANETIEQLQQRVVDVISAALSQSVTDGLWYLDLIRDNYTAASLPLIDEGNISELELQPSRIDGINQVVVQYNDPITRTQPVTVPAQSRGAIAAADRIVPVTRQYLEVPTAELASRLAQRDVDANATPLLRGRVTLDRALYKLRRGQPFRLSYAPRGLSEVVFRIVEIHYGTVVDGKMTLSIAQDVFGMPSATYTAVAPSGWAPADTTANAPAQHQLVEASYRDLAQVLSAADLAALDADAGYVHEIATRPDSTAVNYTLQTRLSGGTFKTAAMGDWCPTATLAAAMPQEAGPTDVTLSALSDVDLVEVGTAALINNEILRVDAIDAAAGTATLARGCADTVPELHAIGTRVYFYENYTGDDTTEYVTGETVEAVALTRTGADELDPTAAPVDSVTLAQRQDRPYPPGALTINGAVYPASAMDALALTWAHRDRITQADNLIDTTAGSVGPESGVTYNVRAYLGGSLISETDGVTGTSLTVSSLGDNGVATIEIDAVRGSDVSMQSLNANFDYTITNSRTSQRAAIISTFFGSGEAGFYFDMSDLTSLFKDAAATSAAAVNGVVGCIKDQTANGNMATQSTTGSKPTVKYDAAQSRYYLDFAGDYLQGVLNGFAGNFDGNTSKTIIVLAETTKSSGAHPFFILGQAGTNGKSFGFANNFTSNVINLFQWGADVKYSPAQTDFAVYAGVKNGNSLTTYKDGTQLATTSALAAANLTAADFWIGRMGVYSDVFTGKIYAMLLVDRAITTAELSTAQANL